MRHRKVLILKCLTDIRAVARIADVSRNTVTKLVIDAGKACADYQDRTLRGLSCQRVQVDEAWCFVYAKAKNVPARSRASRTLATCGPDRHQTCPGWQVGDRSGATAIDLMDDLRARLTNRVHATATKRTWRPSRAHSGATWTRSIMYGEADAREALQPGNLYRHPQASVEGDPDPDYVSTSYIERQNLTMRMSMRRFTRLTNAFSKKLENQRDRAALHGLQLLPCDTGDGSGRHDRLWEIADVVDMVEAAAPKPRPRGPYRKQISN